MVEYLLFTNIYDFSCNCSFYIYSFQTAPRSILQCTHVAEGHSKAVLTICATNDLLFSGSKGNLYSYCH